MFIKHAVPVAVIPQHSGLEEVLRAEGIRLSPLGAGGVGDFIRRTQVKDVFSSIEKKTESFTCITPFFIIFAGVVTNRTKQRQTAPTAVPTGL